MPLCFCPKCRFKVHAIPAQNNPLTLRCSVCNRELELGSIIQFQLPGEELDRQFAEKYDEYKLEQERMRLEREYRKLLERYEIDYLYHMTLLGNVESILRHGLCSRRKARLYNPIEIADHGIIIGTNQKRDPIYHRFICDYARLYFNPHNRMLRHDNLKTEDVHQNLCVLAIHPMVLFQAGTIFSTANAAANIAEFYEGCEHLFQLDWELINHRHIYRGRESRQHQMAEVLVPDRIEPELIREIYCTTESASLKLLSIKRRFNLNDLAISILSDAFFLR